MYLRMNIEAMSHSALVRVIRRIAGAALEGVGATNESIERSATVIGEACGNVVRHAYDTPALYEVSLEIGPDSLSIKVLDYGKGFDTSAEPEAGSLGLSIISSTADALTIESSPGERTLVSAKVKLDYEPGKALSIYGSTEGL